MPSRLLEEKYYTLTQVAKPQGIYPHTARWYVNYDQLPAQKLPGVGHIVAERDALDVKMRRRRRNKPAADEG